MVISCSTISTFGSALYEFIIFFSLLYSSDCFVIFLFGVSSVTLYQLKRRVSLPDLWPCLATCSNFEIPCFLFSLFKEGMPVSSCPGDFFIKSLDEGFTLMRNSPDEKKDSSGRLVD